MNTLQAMKNKARGTWVKLKDRTRGTWAKWRKRRAFWLGLGAAVVLCTGAVVAIIGAPELADDLHIAVARPTVQQLREHVKNDPGDAGTRLQLGHALFEANNRAAALREYDRALARDKAVADGKLLDNLVACFGRKEQGDAASIIVRFKLAEVEGRLDDLARHPTYTVRWGALQTLERLGKASRADFVNAWIKDLDSQKCEVRQAAVENLGIEGDKRALEAIRVAKKKDQETRSFFGATCLGNRPEEAEKRLLTAR